MAGVLYPPWSKLRLGRMGEMSHDLTYTKTAKGQPMVVCKCGMSVFNNGYSDATWHELRGKFVEAHIDPYWYFTCESSEYGKDEFGPYLSKEKADEGAERVKDFARLLNDGIDRWYSEPYTRIVKMLHDVTNCLRDLVQAVDAERATITDPKTSAIERNGLWKMSPQNCASLMSFCN